MKPSSNHDGLGFRGPTLITVDVGICMQLAEHAGSLAYSITSLQTLTDCTTCFKAELLHVQLWDALAAGSKCLLKACAVIVHVSCDHADGFLLAESFVHLFQCWKPHMHLVTPLAAFPHTMQHCSELSAETCQACLQGPLPAAVLVTVAYYFRRTVLLPKTCSAAT